MTIEDSTALGRVILGIAITGFGILCVGYADFVSALQPVPASLPGYNSFAVLTGAVLLATGMAIVANRNIGLATRIVIVFLVSWILLLHVPSAFLEPRLLRSPWWIRTFETLALTGAATILAAPADSPVRTKWLRAGRIAYGVGLPVFGTLHLIYPESVAALIPPWYPFPMFLAYFTGFAQVAGGLAIVSNVLSRAAALLAGVMYGTWALTLHIPRVWCRVNGPCGFMPEVVGLQGSRPGLTSMFVAIGMCGAAWVVAGSLSQHSAAQKREHTVPSIAPRADTATHP